MKERICSLHLKRENTLDEAGVVIEAKIVGEVLEKLRSLGKQEAGLLFREFENYRELLSHVSENISDCIR